MMTEKYVALTGEIKNIQEVKNRFELRKILAYAVKTVNDKYKNYAYGSISFTKADEFQGLFKNGLYVFEIIELFQKLIKPNEARFGIGIESITSDSAFTNNLLCDDNLSFARKAVTEIKKCHEYGTGRLTNVWVLGFRDLDLQNSVNQMLVLNSRIRSRWTQEQSDFVDEIIIKYGINTDFTQTELAKMLSEPKYTINKKIKSSSFYDYAYTLVLAGSLIEKERAGL